MIRKFIRTGSVSDDMTTEGYTTREQEIIIIKEERTIIVMDYAGGDVNVVMVGRDDDPPARCTWKRPPYTDGLYV